MTGTAKRWLMIWTLTAAGACGGATSSPTNKDGSGGNDMAGGLIPSPGTGNGVDQNFGSVEPNDTPQQATPLGVASTGTVYTWVNGNSIGGGDASDYFVFESGSAAGTFTLGGSGLCWGAPITSLTATLWKVSQGKEVTPPVGTWTDYLSDAGTGNCLAGTANIEANTEYLLGVVATGGVGQYGA
jgi:hypothetical protein